MNAALRLVSMTENPVTVNYDVTIIPTTDSHIRELSRNIRDDDKREIEAYGFSCAKGLWRSYKEGLGNRTALINGRVAACWGVGGIYMGAIGQPWLLTSYEVYKISPLRFARIYQKEVKSMLQIFPYLVNYVLADYDEAIRLLSIIGFEIAEPIKMGNGLYRKFSMGDR